MKKDSYAFILLLFVMLTACRAPITTPAPTLAATPTAASTPTAPPAPTSTIQPTATPLRDLIHPFTIAGLREHPYGNGDITITATLLSTPEYTRYAISYPSDGLTITGIMQVPPGAGPFPVIILNHGFYNRDSYRPGDGTSEVAQVLNRNGYLTIASDYRSWGGSDQGYSLFHTGLVIDVINLVNTIPSIPQADQSQLGMWGHSMGAGITTKVLVLDQRIRAAVLYSPNSADDADLIARWGYGCIGSINPNQCNAADLLPPNLPQELVQAYQQAAVNPETLRLIAPIHHLESILSPIQIHIGDADGDYIGSTPPEWSYKLHGALIAADKPVELFIYPGQRHFFTGEAHQLFLQRVVGFFDRYVKDGR